MAETLIGTVKWFDVRKGFGVLEPEGQKIFIHFAKFVGEGFKTLSKGQEVTFEISPGPKGPSAVNVVQK